MSFQNEAFATPKFTPESPSHWKPDDSRVNCSNPDCRVNFSIFTRKHHCRSCLEIYCDNCSNYRLKARSKREPNLIVRVRVCKKCFDTFRTRKETGRTIRRANRTVNPSLNATVNPSINQSIKKQLAEPVKDGKVSTTQSITQSTTQSIKTTNLDGPSLAPVELSVHPSINPSINQSINGPIPVGKLSVVSSHSEEDDFYSDDEGDHPVETDDESDPSTNQSTNRSANQSTKQSTNRSTITLDGDKLPSVHFSTDKNEFFTIEEESANRSTNPSIDQSIEPKIVSEEHDDKLTNQSINLDGGKIDNLIYSQLPMTLTGRLNQSTNQTVNRSMHSVDQSAVIDLLNSKSDRLFEKDSINQSTNQSIEKRDISLDGPSVVPIVTTNQSINLSTNQPMKPMISMNLDSSNMDQNRIVIDPASINQPINQSTNQSVKPSPKKGKKSPKKSPKKTIKPINQSTSQSINPSINTSTNQLTELDRPFSSTNRSIVSGVGSFNQSINGPDVTTNQSIEQPTNQSIIHNQDAAEDRLMQQWIDSSVDSSIDQSIDQSEDSVMSTKSPSPIGLAALPKQKSINQSTNQSTTKSLLDRTKQSTNQSTNQSDDCAPLSGEIDAAQNWAQSINQSTNRSTGLPVPPACWPNAELVDTMNHSTSQSTNQSTSQSTDQSIGQSSDDDLNDMWSPIGGRTSASPMGLAAMNLSTNQSTNPSLNRSTSSSSGEFSSGGKRKVKVLVRRNAVTSWRQRLMHPVPIVGLVVGLIMISAFLLPGTVIGLMIIAAIAGAIAYFWPSVSNVVAASVPTNQSTNQSTSHSIKPAINRSINENAKERSNQSINQSSSLLNDRSSHLTGMSKDQSINQSINQSVDRLAARNSSIEVQREHRVKRIV